MLSRGPAVVGLALLLLLAPPVAVSWALASPEALPTGRAVLVVPDEYPTIQDAVEAASDGDVIYVRAGVYVESVTVEWKSLTILAEEGAVLTPSSSYSYSLRVASGALNVTGLAIDCTGLEGTVAVQVEGATVTLHDSVISGCRGVFSLIGNAHAALDSSRAEGIGYLARVDYGTGEVAVRSSVVEGCPVTFNLAYLEVEGSTLAAGAGGQGSLGPCSLRAVNARLTNVTLADISIVLSGSGHGSAELSNVTLDNSSIGVDDYYNVYLRGLALEGGGPAGLWASAASLVAVEGVETRGVPEVYITLQAPYVYVSNAHLDARGMLEVWREDGSTAEVRDSTIRLEAMNIHSFGRVTLSNVSVETANYTVLQARDVLEVVDSTLETPEAPPDLPPPVHLEASYVYLHSTRLSDSVEATASESMQVTGSRVDGVLAVFIGWGGRLSISNTSIDRLEARLERGGSTVEVADSTITGTVVEGANYVYITNLHAEGCQEACLKALDFQVLNLTNSILVPHGGVALNASGARLAVADTALAGGWVVSVDSAWLVNAALGPGNYTTKAGSVLLRGCGVYSANLTLTTAEALLTQSTLNDTSIVVVVSEQRGRFALEGAVLSGGSMMASLPPGSLLLVNSSRLEGLQSLEVEGRGQLAIISSIVEAAAGLRIAGEIELTAFNSSIAGRGGASIVFDPASTLSLRGVNLTGALSPVVGLDACSLSVTAVDATVNGAPLLVNPREPPTGPVGQVILVGARAPPLILPAPTGPAAPYLLAVDSEIPLLTVNATGEASVLLACSRAVIVNSTLAEPGSLTLVSSSVTIYLSTLAADAVVDPFQGSAVNLTSPAPLVYAYNGSVYTGLLGNHWLGVRVSDLDGDGVGDAPVYAGDFVDCAPLAAPPGEYVVLGEGEAAGLASDTVPPGGFLEVVVNVPGRVDVYIDGLHAYSGAATRGIITVPLPASVEEGVHEALIVVSAEPPCRGVYESRYTFTVAAQPPPGGQTTTTATQPPAATTAPHQPTPPYTTTPPATATPPGATTPTWGDTGQPAPPPQETRQPWQPPTTPATTSAAPSPQAASGVARVLAWILNLALAAVGVYLTVKR